MAAEQEPAELEPSEQEPTESQHPQSEEVESRDIYLAPGVLDTEQPFISPDPLSPGQPYEGVRIPFNYFLYLMNGDKMAQRAHATMAARPASAKINTVYSNVLVAGTGRIVNKFGVDKTRELLLNGKGSSEDLAYVRTIMDLEDVRADVSRAIAETLDLQQTRVLMPLTGELTQDTRKLDSFLEEVARLDKDKDKDVIDWSIGRTVFGDILRKYTLPGRLRDSDDADEESCLYQLSESALAMDIILNRKGKYMTPRGGDTLKDAASAAKIRDIKKKYMTPGEKKDADNASKKERVSISENLYLATIGRLDTLGLVDEAEALERYWTVTEELNGYAAYLSKPSTSPKPAEDVDPYYDPNGSDKYGPYRVPGIPWINGSLDQIAPPDGFGIDGAAMGMVIQGVNPVMRHVWRGARLDPQVQARAGATWPDAKFDSILSWVDNQKQAVPKRPVTSEDFNDMVRGIARAILKRYLIIREIRENGEEKIPAPTT